ncbi:hypothetical protein [Vibrio genomosp. F10]|uniref:Uncharacterized protein n=1 Tax=Vibrio genomosp. F10 TaxID=723171 RepID=A0A1B9R2N6_9VIBR|nr:hypothetical protein [Vibrio genomosp. F10]OCH78418.1 hypothetical protein A6E14_17910 [Vibrio genomosp. F10]
MKTQLISVDDLGYKKHNRSYSQRYRMHQHKKDTDPIARDYYRQLAWFEHDILAWFERLTDHHKERVLRYKASSTHIKYQEIDFIATSELGFSFVS